MRGWGLLLVPMALGSCSVNFEGACQRAFTAACDHQVLCDHAEDHASCDDAIRDRYFCDPTKGIPDYEECYQAEGTSCRQLLPEPCYTVLCDQALGCIATESGTTNETVITTY